MSMLNVVASKELLDIILKGLSDKAVGELCRVSDYFNYVLHPILFQRGLERREEEVAERAEGHCSSDSDSISFCLSSGYQSS